MKQFSIKKTIQVLSYIQKKALCKDMIKLLKLCFFSDRKMIRTFGVPILFDDYCALKYGPVCSQTKNVLLQDFDFLNLDSEEMELVERRIKKIGPHDIEISEDCENYLSGAEKRAIDFAIDTFNKFAPFDLVELTHDYPEWKKWEQAISSTNQSEKMDYIDFFENPNEKKALHKFLNGIDPFYAAPEELEIVKEMYLQNYGN